MCYLTDWFCCCGILYNIGKTSEKNIYVLRNAKCVSLSSVAHFSWSKLYFGHSPYKKAHTKLDMLINWLWPSFKSIAGKKEYIVFSIHKLNKRLGSCLSAWPHLSTVLCSLKGMENRPADCGHQSTYEYIFGYNLNTILGLNAVWVSCSPTATVENKHNTFKQLLHISTWHASPFLRLSCLSCDMFSFLSLSERVWKCISMCCGIQS